MQALADEASIAILTELINTANGEPDELIDLYVLRSAVHSQTGNSQEVENDALFGLTLGPEQPELLNRLGYSWVLRDRLLPAAVHLLERAVAGAPESPEIKDSLGWAYVKSGNLEKGLVLINNAAIAAPKSAEIRAHLADTYRRLGQTEEAKQAFDAALSLDPSETVLRFIETQQKLLGVTVTPTPSEDEAITAIADALGKHDFKARPSISTDALGIAIQGFDPVAYVTSDRPVLGHPRHFEIWDGAIWLFENADNRNRFIQGPERYVPAYGGYCSYCMATGHKFHADPYAWVIHENKTYLHASIGLRDAWLQNPNIYIKAADGQWVYYADRTISPASSHKIAKKVVAAIKARSADNVGPNNVRGTVRSSDPMEGTRP
jgi:tetratricopeptide (TPR) repeat protein